MRRALVPLLVMADVAAAGPSPHHDQMLAFGASLPPKPVLEAGPIPEPTPGPDTTVYGYQAYWDNDLATVPWDQLSHLAVFTAGVDASGNLTSTTRWALTEDAVALAEPYGVRVHLVVANFAPSELEALLGSESARGRLIDGLVQWLDDTGAHGVNIDFEGLPASRRDQMVTFVRDLEAAVGEVVLATPSVDWRGSWDYAALSEHADLFIMGYGYHYSGSSQAGPVDPLFGGSPWNKYALDWTVQDYLAAGADPSRVILGLPLYGIGWPTGSDAVPASTTGSGSAIFWRSAWDEAERHGRRFEEVSRTPWYFDGTDQVWYGDLDSLRERIQYCDEQGIGGFGFWALHYDGDDPALWDMIREETAPLPPDDPGDDPEVSGDFVAEAGGAFLAYVGDTVVLSGRGSRGPEAVPLQYTWTQVQGPVVALSDPTAMEPRFEVTEAGTTVFELVVGDGAAVSAPDRSYVVVIDRDVARRHATGCGCQAGSGAAGGFAMLLALLAYSRRRSSGSSS